MLKSTFSRSVTLIEAFCFSSAKRNFVNKLPVASIHRDIKQTRQFCSSFSCRNMNLSSVIHILEDGASLNLAESWDNVGLLVEPSPPHTVHKVLLSNDLTLDVCEEAITKKYDLILSYHPPIFSPLKCLTQKSVKEKIIVKCIENRIAVYSPHTVYDNMRDGVNQWIIEAFNEYGLDEIRPLNCKYAYTPPGGATHQMTMVLSPKADLLVSKVRATLFPDTGTAELMSRTIVDIKESDGSGDEKLRLNLRLNESQMTPVIELLEEFPGVLETCSVHKLEKLLMPGYGSGLKASLKNPMTVKDAIKCVKNRMKLGNVRLAMGREKDLESTVKSVAVCAGSGRSVLAGCKAMLYVTGEMSHHDILACTEAGTTIILTEHSNSERGFLAVLKERLERKFEQTEVNFTLSERDHDPISIV